MKVLINIKNNDNKCFLRHLNPLKIHPERITKADKSMANDLDYEGIEFRTRSSKTIIFASMYFVMKMIWFILLIYQMRNLEIVWIY